jgi:Family of unknown function (DUF6188)
MSDSASLVRGLACEHVAYDEKTFEWVFRFGSIASLRVAAPWRIVAQARIALGSDDHGQQFGLPRPVDGVANAVALLGCRMVEAFSVSPVSADLVIDFGDGVRLEIFNSSSGYEAWVLATRDGRCLIAQGGGRVVEFDGPRSR